MHFQGTRRHTSEICNIAEYASDNFKLHIQGTLLRIS